MYYPEDGELAIAAASLTVDDFAYLQRQGTIAESSPAADRSTDTHVTITRPEAKKRRSRRTVKHQWPEIGQILQTDYQGAHYQAEVVAARRYKSGRALKILTGPAEGAVCHSMTGAMLKATEAQRQENNLNRKGLANGWSFWHVKEGVDT